MATYSLPATKIAANAAKSACLDALSCRFFILGEPQNKTAAKPSPLETLRVGGACALRLRETRRRAERGVSETERASLRGLVYQSA